MPDLVFYFELIVFLLVLTILSLAVIQDIKTRMVDGIYWLILFIIAILVIIIRLVLYWDHPAIVILIISSMLFGIVFSILIAYFGLWGEADVLAMITLSLTVPLSLVQASNGFFTSQQDLSSFLPFSITVIMNASIIQLPLPFFIFFKNIFAYNSDKKYYNQIHEPMYRKFLASFVGQPLSLENILKKPVWYYQVLEKYRPDQNNPLLHEQLNSYPLPFVRLNSEEIYRWKLYRGKNIKLIKPNHAHYYNINKLLHQKSNEWSFDFSIGLKSEEEDLFRQRTTLHYALEDRNKKALWVQFSVPFLLPLTIGFILSFFNVNVLLLLLNLFK